MADRLRLYFPVRPSVINQHFGESKPCVVDFGLPTQKVIASNPDNTCPVGSDKLYPHFGMTGHNGTDIAAGEQRIYAACAGLVIEKQTVPSRGFGLGVLTDEPVFLDAFGTHFAKLRYWHLKSFNVEVGQHVKEGDILGITDNTGYSSADHLHFELDPMDKDAGGHPFYVNPPGSIASSVDAEPFFCGIYADVVQQEIGLWQKIVTAITNWIAAHKP